MIGKIVRLFSDKHFGFIAAVGYENDLFFHKSALVGREFDDLRVGDAVTFEADTAADPLRGPRCAVVRVDGPV
jgi:cold shock CspA family protein